MKRSSKSLAISAVLLLGAAGHATGSDVSRLVASMLGETPLIDDLRVLTDEIGGRPTGSEANLRSVEWGLERFAEAGVSARKEAFTMPARWLGRSAAARITGKGVSFSPRVVSMPFSTATGGELASAPLVDGGRGLNGDLQRLGEGVKGAFVLIETDELEDVPGLFREYTDAAAIEKRLLPAGAAGIIYMGSRPGNQLHRHNASRGPANEHPMLAMERDGAARALRLLRQGLDLQILVSIDVDSGGPYESYNVIGEIRGHGKPEEFVVIGAHLDSWGLGTGALDNGANVALVIDIARQMRRLRLTPRRTIRFALFNGEEQGLHGSWGYTLTHAGALDRHVMASSYDLGSGRINGYYTGGRPEVQAAVERALEPVRGLGPFVSVDEPVVGTDNYDFMMQGIGNLVASQESANYGPNYHARSDTFDRVDQEQLRLNAAIAAAVTWAFAEMDVDWKRQDRQEVEELVNRTTLGDQMKTFGLWEPWASGQRGRSR